MPETALSRHRNLNRVAVTSVVVLLLALPANPVIGKPTPPPGGGFPRKAITPGPIPPDLYVVLQKVKDSGLPHRSDIDRYGTMQFQLRSTPFDACFSIPIPVRFRYADGYSENISCEMSRSVGCFDAWGCNFSRSQTDPHGAVVEVRVDPANEIAESNENNNVWPVIPKASWGTTVSKPKVAKAVPPPAPGKKPDLTAIWATNKNQILIRNIGDAVSPPFAVRYRVESGEVKDLQFFKYLSPDPNDHFTFPLEGPMDIVEVVVDPNNQVAESNENNNVWKSKKMSYPPGGSRALPGISPPPTIQPGRRRESSRRLLPATPTPTPSARRRD